MSKYWLSTRMCLVVDINNDDAPATVHIGEHSSSYTEAVVNASVGDCCDIPLTAEELEALEKISPQINDAINASKRQFPPAH